MRNTSSNETSFPTVDLCIDYRSYNTLSFANHVYITFVIVSCLNILTAITAISGNALVLSVVLTNKNLQTNCNVLIAWLSVTDLAVGLIVEPLYSVLLIQSVSGTVNCSVLVALCLLLYCFPILSFISIGIITIDRYLSVIHAYVYPKLVNKTRLCLVTAVLWVSWIIYLFTRGVEKLVDPNDKLTKFFMFVVDVFLLIATSVAYTKIFNLAKKHSKQIAAQRQSYRKRPKRQSRRRISTQEKEFYQATKASKTTAIILGTIYACYLPWICTLLVAGIEGLRPYIRLVVYPWVTVLMNLNSSLNPCIYVLRNAEMRKAIMKLLRMRGGRVQPAPFNNRITFVEESGR